MEKIPEIIHPSWHPHLQHLFDDPKMILINNKTLPNCHFYPEAKDIFRVFRMRLDSIKVVALGQDPYAKGEAIGYAFAVKQTTPIPASLNIIRSEIVRSKVERDQLYNIDSDKWRELLGWEMQGIFLLNAALTVEKFGSGSHVRIWEWFTKRIVNIISVQNPCVWLLWGAKAKGFKSCINNPVTYYGKYIGANPEKVNFILEADHPAAETYKDSKYKFSGCNHFNLCNEILRLRKQSIINW